jgi:hypothetical protein
MRIKKGKSQAKAGPLDDRQKVWRHNSFFGFVGMMKSQLTSIASASTATPEAKLQAQKIKVEVEKLGELLKTRVGV